MNKELSEVLKRMKIELAHDNGARLTKKELSMVLKYIYDLEIEISGGIDE